MQLAVLELYTWISLCQNPQRHPGQSIIHQQAGAHKFPIW